MAANDYYKDQPQQQQGYYPPQGGPQQAQGGYYPQQPPNSYQQGGYQGAPYQGPPQGYPQQGYQPNPPPQTIYVQQPAQQSSGPGAGTGCMACLAGCCLCCCAEEICECLF
ncbi:hypothetical protein B0H15DRAFT_838683 [Mycena belliarum]|uniref:Cysteine-rich transmembrane domain-containing protein n=1 Tax=Mycena belliarum TaxID=1033014 RepID=A0AAD6XPG9_9AGAR|nr:hypothetical protein B0H15DRAFT_838683 [Mycena belliae]